MASHGNTLVRSPTVLNIVHLVRSSVLTCSVFRVCLASVQPSFLLYRWSRCCRACPTFPGCQHVMLHQCFIDISSSPPHLRDRRRCSLCLVMSSTCLLFDFHSAFCWFHLISLHELCFPVISQSNNIGLIRGMIFVSKCAVRTHSIGVATLPLEGKLIPRCTTTHPWFSETNVMRTPNQLTHQDVLDLSPTLVCLVFFVPCRHVSPVNTCCAVSFLLNDFRCCHAQCVVACTSSSWSGALTCVASLLLVAAVSSGQLLDDRKLLDSSLAFCDPNKCPKCPLLAPQYFLFLHNLLSPSFTIFGTYRQNDCSARVHVRNGSVPIECACQHFVDSMLDSSSISTTRIVELVVDCVVAFSPTAANVIWLSRLRPTLAILI